MEQAGKAAAQNQPRVSGEYSSPMGPTVDHTENQPRVSGEYQDEGLQRPVCYRESTPRERGIPSSGVKLAAWFVESTPRERGIPSSVSLSWSKAWESTPRERGIQISRDLLPQRG